MTLKRRDILKLASTAPLLTPLLAPEFSLAMSRQPDAEYDYILTASETPVSIVDGGTTPAFTFNDGFPAPVIRVKQGRRVRIRFINNLSQASTIHWHGVRIDNAMDGVPFLTQLPVEPGESFDYEFTCPDAGTFWYHPHMHSIEQLGKGLVGALVVEEEHKPDFDQDVILGFKDWRLKSDGSFMPLSDPRHAFRAGTLGNIATVNGQQLPKIEVPANAKLRLRLLNMDNTRQFAFSFGDHPATLLARDGMPIEPRALEVQDLGVGMRLDIGVITPATADVEIPVYDVKGRFFMKVCTLVTTRPLRKTTPTALPRLPANPVSDPDLDNAEKLNFVFEWQGAVTPTTAHGETDHKFWTINRRSWEGVSEHSIPEPLAELSLGKSYIFELYNATPHSHPIHLHGLIFKVLRSDKKTVEPHFADTVLMEKYERIQIAFVADNPGQWMYHCHVIEHMKTGLMGYVKIS